MASTSSSIPPRVHRTTIDIELDAYEQAREILGTAGFKDTVNAALKRVGRDQALSEAAARIRNGRFLAPSPDELSILRRRKRG